MGKKKADGKPPAFFDFNFNYWTIVGIELVDLPQKNEDKSDSTKP